MTEGDQRLLELKNSIKGLEGIELTELMEFIEKIIRESEYRNIT